MEWLKSMQGEVVSMDTAPLINFAAIHRLDVLTATSGMFKGKYDKRERYDMYDLRL